MGQNVIVTGSFMVTDTDTVLWAYYPPNLGAQGELMPPTVVPSVFTAEGKLSGVTVRHEPSTLTLNNMQFAVIRDLRTYPDGSTEGVETTVLDIDNAVDERKVFVSDLISTTTGDATVADVDDRLDNPEPFDHGFWIILNVDSTSGSGTSEVKYRLNLELERV